MSIKSEAITVQHKKKLYSKLGNFVLLIGVIELVTNIRSIVLSNFKSVKFTKEQTKKNNSNGKTLILSKYRQQSIQIILKSTKVSLQNN